MIEFTLKVLQKKNIPYSYLQNIGLFPLLDSATCVHMQKSAGTASPGLQSKRQLPTLPVTQYHRHDETFSVPGMGRWNPCAIATE